MTVDPWLSKAETECLRALIGKRIHRIFGAMLTVYNDKIRIVPPAVVPLFVDDFSRAGFLIMEVGELTTQVENKPVSLQSRPTFRHTDTEPSMPVIHSGNKHIVSGSDIDLEEYFSFTRIEAFQCNAEANVTVEGVIHTVPMCCDAQITFYSGESMPFSIGANFEFLYFMRGLGLVSDRSFNLSRRMVLG